ncbi:hypothetical protein TYRP_017748, partial [Tyrophagus putrescentiae]
MTVSDQGENIQPTAVPVESTVPQTAGIDPTVVDPVPPGPAFTPDASVPMPRPSKPRFDRFNRWMKVLNEFFTKGNWLNGGPDDLLQYIGSTLTKLMDILMNRNLDDVTTSQLFGDYAPQARAVLQKDRSQLTVADILRMIPQDRLNVPADRHLSVAAIAEGENAQFVGLSAHQIGDDGLQRAAVQVLVHLNGARDGMVGVPVAHLVALDGLLGGGQGADAAPGDQHRPPVDRSHIDGGGVLLGGGLEGARQEGLALRAGTGLIVRHHGDVVLGVGQQADDQAPGLVRVALQKLQGVQLRVLIELPVLDAVAN